MDEVWREVRFDDGDERLNFEAVWHTGLRVLLLLLLMGAGAAVADCVRVCCLFAHFLLKISEDKARRDGSDTRVKTPQDRQVPSTSWIIRP